MAIAPFGVFREGKNAICVLTFRKEKENMTEKEYFIVHKSLLPEFYDQVIRARDLVDNEGCSVSYACDTTGISRSTFYKYKDSIFYPSKEYGRKAIFALKTMDKRGVLSNILNLVYENDGSVISINQGIPIKDTAYITITVDLQEYKGMIEELIVKFKKIKGVKSVTLLAID